MNPPKIEIGTAEMRNAFEAGLDHYQPTAGGHDLGCEEAGVTMHTQVNLRDLFAMLPDSERPTKIEAGPKGNVLIHWPMLETYLATGFSFGYAGGGSGGLVWFAVMHGFGTEEEVRKRVRGVGTDFQGVLFEKRESHD